jgi:hypothetical protein
MALDWTAFHQFEEFDCQRAGVKASRLPGLEVQVVVDDLQCEVGQFAAEEFAKGYTETFLPLVTNEHDHEHKHVKPQLLDPVVAQSLYGTPNAARLAISNLSSVVSKEFRQASVTVFWRELVGVTIMVLGAARDFQCPDPDMFRAAQTCVKFQQ